MSSAVNLLNALRTVIGNKLNILMYTPMWKITNI